MNLIFEERASKGFVNEVFANQSNPTAKFKESPYTYDILLDMFEVDPVLSTACDLTVDLATYNGYTFVGEDIKEVERAMKMFNEELDFDQIVDNILYQMLIYADAYLEVRWNPSKTQVMELNPRDTQDMRMNYNEHGEIKGYVEEIEAKAEEDYVKYKPDEIIRFSLRRIGSQLYSKHPFKAISKDFSTNIYSNNYLQQIFLNLPPKLIYFLKTASEPQKKEFYQNLLRCKTNPNLDLVMEGEGVDTKLFQVAFDSGLLGVLQWVQKRVLMITRVPPHWVGMMDGANRGIGENVVIPFETKIKKLQQKIASQINKELLPKLKLKDITFKFNSISLMDEKTIIGNMGQLDTIGFDSKTIIDYAKEHGLKIIPDAKIEKLEDEGAISKMRGGAQIQKDAAPSRQREGKSDKMTNNIDKKGVSAAGKQKLEIAQEVKR